MSNLIKTHILILNLGEKSPGFLFAVFPVYFFHSPYILMCQSRHLGVTITYTYRHLAKCLNVFLGLAWQDPTSTLCLCVLHTNNYPQEDAVIR